MHFFRCQQAKLVCAIDDCHSGPQSKVSSYLFQYFERGVFAMPWVEVVSRNHFLTEILPP